MKRLLLIAVLSAIAACSSDDDSKPVETYIDETEFYNTITVYQEESGCGTGLNTVTYCVQEDEYMRVFNMITEQCQEISFKDIDNVTRTGFSKAMNTNNENGCLRNR